MSPETPWPASAVVTVNIGSLKQATQNSRVHTAEQIEQIAASITKFGWTIPVLVDEGFTIIAGHARVEAAKSLGIDEVPIMTVEGWSEAQKEAYQIADNKLAENSSWDMDILGAQIKRLQSVDFDLGVLGWDLETLDPNAFKPTLDPTLNTKLVTQSDMDKKQEQLEGAFDSANNKAPQTYEVNCPHCGEEFEIQI